ncbi:MAG: hypothetical protein FJX77_00875, partial [Armatimonadetes bacterium]|nr:hypothetical protein [Armatimonadota bacterium]
MARRFSARGPARGGRVSSVRHDPAPDCYPRGGGKPETPEAKRGHNEPGGWREREGAVVVRQGRWSRILLGSVILGCWGSVAAGAVGGRPAGRGPVGSSSPPAPGGPSARTPREGLSFEHDVRPILKAYCLDCHGATETLSGKLDLRLRRFLVRGGQNGPAIVPGETTHSLLVRRFLVDDTPTT